MNQSIENAINDYVAEQVAAEHRNAEDAFLYGKFGGEFLGLQRYAEAAKETDFRWNQPGNVGNDPVNIGSDKPTAGYAFSHGETAVLSAKAPNAYANVYLYMRLPLPTVLPRRIVDIRTFQISDLSGWQALEFQSQITMNGMTHNMAYQINLYRGLWRYFDYTNTKWVDLPGIPVPDLRSPVQIAAEFALDAAKTTHVGLNISGQRYVVGIVQDATPTKNSDKFTIAVQIDPKPSALCSLNMAQVDLRTVF